MLKFRDLMTVGQVYKRLPCTLCHYPKFNVNKISGS